MEFCSKTNSKESLLVFRKSLFSEFNTGVYRIVIIRVLYFSNEYTLTKYSPKLKRETVVEDNITLNI